MNAQLMDQARAAYRAGDFSAAAHMFSAAKDAGEVSGEADHLRGNSLMRLGLYADAASAYAEALRDAAYGKRGALLTNQGKALAAAGDLAGAVSSFQAATQDATYPTPYKAYLGLGEALLKAGNPTDAGVAFRQAAIDGTNPAPAMALANLGECFLRIGRAADAVESFRTAVDFCGPKDNARAIDAGLGQAYMADGKPSDAVDAFNRALSDGTYQLSPDQQASFQSAQDALSAERSMATVPGQAQPAAGSRPAPGVDPLDPLGKSGSFMPDPSDTGFFTLSESDMIKQDRQKQKIRRKHRHTGLKVFLTILIILLIAAGGLGFAFTRGLGYPSQQETVTNLFNAVTSGTDTSQFLASGLSDEARNVITSTIPQGATPSIEGMDQSMTETKATVKVTLAKGGTLTYEVDFTRQGIGWVVSNVTADTSASDATAATGTDGSSTDAGSAAAATPTDAGSTADAGSAAVATA